MRSYRPKRVGEMIFRELAMRLRTEVKDDRVGDISITRVEVNRDLSRATIFFLPLGGGAVTDDIEDGLVEAAKQLRGPIGRELRLRHAPELVFVEDTEHDKALRVASLLDQIANERGEGRE
ncbi:MAG: 30S ribosome-binding factor RbfA [Proteobacteria bacterium]|nr:30S ribosome-binding factor RbfA [Pseudomonadota bacterium]